MMAWTWGAAMEMERSQEIWVVTEQYLLWPNWTREENEVVEGGRSQENNHKLSKDSSGNLSGVMLSLKEIINSKGRTSLGSNKVSSVWYKMSLCSFICPTYSIGKLKYRTSNPERDTSQRLWVGNHPKWVIIKAMVLNKITLFLSPILPPLISFLGESFKFRVPEEDINSHKVQS